MKRMLLLGAAIAMATGVWASEAEPVVKVTDSKIEVWGEQTAHGKENCFLVSFKVTSQVANTNVWADFAAYAADKHVYYVGDSISFDGCATYTNAITVAVGEAGVPIEANFVWDCGRYNPSVYSTEEGSGDHIVITARLPDEDVMVECYNGKFVGLKNSETGVCSFKGVPFAKPPTRETGLRWLPPVEPEKSDAVISARYFGPASAQTYEPSEYASRGPVSEDGLKLSIWTADNFDANKHDRAVMFYIHGGSYVLGGMCDPLYDGSNIVKDNRDVIVVSCDYRLCAFGFLDVTGLPGFDPVKHAKYAQAGNLGILDLQAGLRWVQKNIEKFGGDPRKVTIFGESAGGGSVSCLLQAKGSEGLFQRAIVMSGTVDLTDSVDLYKGSNQALLLMKAAGKDNFEELLKCSTKELIDALNVPLTDPRLAGIKHIAPREGGPTVADMNNRPMCDDVRGIVPSDPFAAFATNGIAKDVDVMIGSTSEELNYWAYLMYDYDEGNRVHPLDYYYSFLSNGVRRTQSIYAELGYGAEVQEYLRDIATAHPFDRVPEYTYNGRYPEIWGRTELRSELAFRMPSIIMAEQHLKQVSGLGGTGRTYMYYFCRPQVNPTMPWVGACHGSELATVFKNIHLEVDGTNRVDLANRLSGAFVNFARYGDPNGDPNAAPKQDAEKDPEVDKWETYDTTSRNTMVIGESNDFTNSALRLVSDPKKRQRELLEPGYLGYHAKIANGLEEPAGSAENPWMLGATADDTVVAWTNGTGKLIVLGEGAMKDFAAGAAPWAGAAVSEIEIGFGPDRIGVTNIGANAFANLADVSRIVFHCFRPPAFGASAFAGLGAVTVKTPCGSSKAYEDAFDRAGLDNFTVSHPEPQWRDCRKIADYLYEIWYDGDYTDDECDLNVNPLGGAKPSACSAVRNGNLYGRNLDLPYMDAPNIVAHFAATETRYASLAVMVPSFLSVKENEGEILTNKYREALNIAPSATMTGINEHGVTCNSNVMPISDGVNGIYQLLGEKVIPDMSPAGGTHPEYDASKNLNMGVTVQFVLDNAESAADAIRKLNGRNVYGGLGGFDYMQLMIADADRTLVVEFVGPYTLVIGFGEKDTMEALEQEFADVAASGKVLFVNNGQKPIMTNWWHFFDKTPDTVAFTNRQNHANGVERYRALDRYYDESATFEGMQGLMKRVKFSNVGTLTPGEDEFYPFTDNNVPPRPSWQDFANDPDAVEWANGFREQYNEQIFEKKVRGTFAGNWMTAHSAIIDMEKRMLDIIVWEEWDEPHLFYLAPPPGSEANPWKVGMTGREAEVKAWTNGVGGLMVEGAGAIGSMPWAENWQGITRLVKAEGVAGLEELVGSLPELTSVNGLTREDFGNAIRGFVKADGFSAIEIESGKAFLDVVVERSDSLGDSAGWTPVSTNTVEVPAPGEQGFFIVTPTFYVPVSDYHSPSGTVTRWKPEWR